MNKDEEVQLGFLPTGFFSLRIKFQIVWTIVVEIRQTIGRIVREIRGQIIQSWCWIVQRFVRNCLRRCWGNDAVAFEWGEGVMIGTIVERRSRPIRIRFRFVRIVNVIRCAGWIRRIRREWTLKRIRIERGGIKGNVIFIRPNRWFDSIHCWRIQSGCTRWWGGRGRRWRRGFPIRCDSGNLRRRQRRRWTRQRFFLIASITRNERIQRLRVTNETINVTFTRNFLHDSFFVIVTKRTRQFIVVHRRTILLHTPETRDLSRDENDSMSNRRRNSQRTSSGSTSLNSKPLPVQMMIVPFRPIFQQSQEELPQLHWTSTTVQLRIAHRIPSAFCNDRRVEREARGVSSYRFDFFAVHWPTDPTFSCSMVRLNWWSENWRRRRRNETTVLIWDSPFRNKGTLVNDRVILSE